MSQDKDPDISPVLSWVKTGEKPDKRTLGPYSAMTKTLVSQWPFLVLRDECLYRKVRRSGTDDEFYQFVVPLALRPLILEQLHDLRIVGHMRIARTTNHLQKRFYWAGMEPDVARWCVSCHECAG